jgi:hypothetical protein
MDRGCSPRKSRLHTRSCRFHRRSIPRSYSPRRYLTHAAFSIDTCSFHRVCCCFAVGAFRQKVPPGPARLCPTNSFPGGWTLHSRMPAQRRPMTPTYCRCAGRGSVPFSPVQAPQDDCNDIHRGYPPLTTLTIVSTEPNNIPISQPAQGTRAARLSSRLGGDSL